MIEVHHFKIRNVNTGAWDIPPSKRTAKTISEMKGQIIPNTGEQISAAKLDSQGRYFPTDTERPVDERKVKSKPK